MRAECPTSNEKPPNLDCSSALAIRVLHLAEFIIERALDYFAQILQGCNVEPKVQKLF